MNGLQGVTLHDLLLVEDNFADVVLMEEAFEANVKHLRLSKAEDGVEALTFLRREGKYTSAPRPKLVLLDLNLPRLNGFEVLAAMRADETLRALPVLILSTSQAASDVERAYMLGANAYLTKPHDLPGFFDLVRLIEQFWLTAARLPGGNGR